MHLDTSSLSVFCVKFMWLIYLPLVKNETLAINVLLWRPPYITVVVIYLTSYVHNVTKQILKQKT